MKTSSWYLKKPDGTIYGPVRLSDLKRWVRDSRVAPVDQLSTDKQEWMPPSELVALEMNYLVRYRSGVDYGPVHLRALGELIMDGDVPLDEPVYNKTTQLTLPACVMAIRGLMAEEPPEPVAPQELAHRDAAELHAEYEAVLNKVRAELKAQLEKEGARREEAEQKAEAARQSASAGEAGLQANAVVRTALAQAKARALRSSATMHAPRSPARKKRYHG